MVITKSLCGFVSNQVQYIYLHLNSLIYTVITHTHTHIHTHTHTHIYICISTVYISLNASIYRFC